MVLHPPVAHDRNKAMAAQNCAVYSCAFLGAALASMDMMQLIIHLPSKKHIEF